MNDSSNSENSIIHINDLYSYFDSLAKENEFKYFSKDFIDYNTKKEAFLIKAINYYLKLGNFNKACNLLLEFKDFERASIISPFVSIDKWKEINQKYLIYKINNNDVINNNINNNNCKINTEYIKDFPYLINFNKADINNIIDYFKNKKDYNTCKLIWITRLVNDSSSKDNNEINFKNTVNNIIKCFVLNDNTTNNNKDSSNDEQVLDILINIDNEIIEECILKENNSIKAACYFFSANRFDIGCIYLLKADLPEIVYLLLISILEIEEKYLNQQQIVIQNDFKCYLYSETLINIIRKELRILGTYSNTIKILCLTYEKTKDVFLLKLTVKLIIYACNVLDNSNIISQFNTYLGLGRENILSIVENDKKINKYISNNDNRLFSYNELSHNLFISLIKLDYDKIVNIFICYFEEFNNNVLTILIKSSNSIDINQLRIICYNLKESINYINVIQAKLVVKDGNFKIISKIIIASAFIEVIANNLKAVSLLCYELFRLIKLGHRLDSTEARYISLISAYLMNNNNVLYNNNKLVFYDIPNEIKKISDNESLIIISKNIMYLYFIIPSNSNIYNDKNYYTNNIQKDLIKANYPMFYCLKEEIYPCNLNYLKRSSFSGCVIKSQPKVIDKGKYFISNSESLEWLRSCSFAPLKEDIRNIEYLL